MGDHCESSFMFMVITMLCVVGMIGVMAVTLVVLVYRRRRRIKKYTRSGGRYVSVEWVSACVRVHTYTRGFHLLIQQRAPSVRGGQSGPWKIETI